MYIALSKVRFAREYQKGEMIPEEAVDRNMVLKLLRCGVIGELPKDKRKKKEQEDNKELEVEKIKKG